MHTVFVLIVLSAAILYSIIMVFEALFKHTIAPILIVRGSYSNKIVNMFAHRLNTPIVTPITASLMFLFVNPLTNVIREYKSSQVFEIESNCSRRVPISSSKSSYRSSIMLLYSA